SDREGPSGRDGLRLRVADGADESSDDRHRDVLRPDQPAVVVPVLVADQGDRAARRGRLRHGPGGQPPPPARPGGGRRLTVDIVGRLQQLEAMVREARSMPLSTSAIVPRDEMLEILEAAKNDLPEEIKQARWVVKDREELLDKARRDA